MISVVKYINKEPHIIGEVLNIDEFYSRYMKQNRVSNMREWIDQNEKEGCHIITRHSSITGEILFLIKPIDYVG